MLIRNCIATICLLALIQTSFAANTTIKLKPGEVFRVDCVGGTTPPNPQPTPTPTPTPTPPPPVGSCPKPEIPIAVTKALEIGPKRRVALSTGRATVYRFKGRDLPSGVITIAGEHAPGAPNASPGTSISVYTCPAIWDYETVGLKCVVQGREVALRIGSNSCPVDPKKDYYVNVSAMGSQNLRPTCQYTTCGIVFQASKQ